MSSSIPRCNTQFQPILLKGHERSITTVKYCADGDLLFTAAKDQRPTLWSAETGERIGTYNNHKGAVWDLDPSWDAKYLLTACGDGQARLFETTTGRWLAKMPHNGAVRAVAWSEGNNRFATASDPFKNDEVGLISIFEFPSIDTLASNPGLNAKGEENAPSHLPLFEIRVDHGDKATSLVWTFGNEYIIVGFDSGYIIKYDATTGKEVIRNNTAHKARVNRITFNTDKTLLISASKDCDSKLFDPNTLEVLKVYKTDRPVNGAVISPTQPHVLIGGGQEAMNVTVTAASKGKFESKFFHMIYEEEFGRVKGHFGPINAIAVHPQGKSFASGSEDGFIRLHHFDKAYLTMPDLVPEDVKNNNNNAATKTHSESEVVEITTDNSHTTTSA